MVGVTGFEPTTSWSRTKRSTKLSHTPKCLITASIPQNYTTETEQMQYLYLKFHKVKIAVVKNVTIFAFDCKILSFWRVNIDFNTELFYYEIVVMEKFRGFIASERK